MTDPDRGGRHRFLREGGSGSVRSIVVASASWALMGLAAGASPLAAQHAHDHPRPDSAVAPDGSGLGREPLDVGAGSRLHRPASAATGAPRASRPARRVVVLPGENLQAVLDSAAAGDTLLVSGEHRGQFRVTLPLTIATAPGERRAHLRGSGTGSTLTLAADSVRIRGLRISGSGRSLESDDAAVMVVRCLGCEVRSVRIEDALHGIYLLESAEVVLADNDIRGPADLEESRRGNGIHLFHSAGNRVEGNRIRLARDGIYFSFATGNDVVGNAVSDLRYGLHYMYSDGNRFRGNRFRRNAAGAAIMFSKGIEFRANEFAEHLGARAFGILLQTAQDVHAEGNRFEGNRVGLFLDNATRSTFRRNAVVGNGVGIDMLSSAEANRFTENAVVGNRIAVRTAGSAVNEWAVEGRGNYWGGDGVLDLDGDGVGDAPYEVGDPFVTLSAGDPVLAMLTGTPAARALAWAERAFPVFALTHVVDPRPLADVPAGVPGWGEAVNGAARSGDRGGSRAMAALAILLVGFVPAALSRLGRAASRLSTRLPKRTAAPGVRP